MLVSGLAMAIAAGVDFLGHPTRQGKTLIISAEDDREEMISRLHDIAQAMGLDEDVVKNNINVFSTCDAAVGPSLLDKNMVATELLGEIRRKVDLMKPELVIIDTLAAMAPTGANLIDAAVATQYICNVIAGLKPTDGSTGPAVLFTHHLRKPGKDAGDCRPTIHDVRDSGAIVGSMRAVMILHRDTLSLDKCNGRMRVESEFRIKKNDAFQLEWKTAPGCLNGALQLKGKARLDEIKAAEQLKVAEDYSARGTRKTGKTARGDNNGAI